MRQLNLGRYGRSLLGIALAGGLLAAPAAHAQARPSDADLYCSGFFTSRVIETGLRVQSSEDAGFKNEFADRDYIYLSRGKDTVVNTGGQYMLLRPKVDGNRKESFPGQALMVKGMGTYYSEIGRIEVQISGGSHVTAQVLHACEEIEVGDIAIPLNVRSTPAYKASKFTSRFAEPSGKASGVIAAAKEFDRVVGEGKIVYLNIGSAQGLQPGSYLRIRRPYSSDVDAFNLDARNYLDNKGLKQRTPLHSELAAYPSEVLGEVMVISAEEKTATAIVTYSRIESQVGDTVELE
jgi:hypothetical protein